MCGTFCFKTEEQYADTDYFVAGLYIKLLQDDGTHSSLTPIKVKEIHIEAEFIDRLYEDNTDYDYTLDYALLTVSEDLSDYTQFDLGVAYDVNSDEFGDVPLYLSGMKDNTVYTGAGQEHPSYASTDTVLYYTCDSVAGQSGSPVYTATRFTVTVGDEIQTNVYYTAFAINVKGGSVRNYGPRFTPTRIRFYKSNSYIGY